MNNLREVKQYEGNNITFVTGNNVKVNATEMAKPFGKHKRPGEWTRTQSAKEFIEILSDAKKIASVDLIEVVKGGIAKYQGTYMHEDVAMEYARWLNPRFAIWTNDMIKELLTKGSVNLQQSGDYSILHISENVVMQVIPSDKHVFLVTNKEFAKAIGITTNGISTNKHRYKSHFEENVHFINDFVAKDYEKNIEYKTTVWTQKGIIEQVQHIRTGNDVVFRDWADRVQNKKPVNLALREIGTKKRKHNRLTPERLISILAQVTKIKDEDIRSNITNELMGGEA